MLWLAAMTMADRGFARLLRLCRATATCHVQLVVVSVGVLAGCADEPELSQTEAASTVNDYGTSSGCSTAVVIGLSNQIAEEAGCENPASFVSFSGAPGITLTSNAVLPFLVKGARDDLEKVAANNSLQINSALRSIAQQYLLVSVVRCNVAAASPRRRPVGHSNHEGGRAVDLANYSSRISAMSAHGWAHDVPGDVVHFDHTNSADDRGQDTKAFQVLWNKNHPNDTIAEDGAYGPQTEARLKQVARDRLRDRSVVHGDARRDRRRGRRSTGPDQARAADQSRTTRSSCRTAGRSIGPRRRASQIDGSSSPLHDTSWISATEVTTLGSAVAVGDQGTIDFDVMTPVESDADTDQHALVDDTGATHRHVQPLAHGGTGRRIPIRAVMAPRATTRTRAAATAAAASAGSRSCCPR